MVELTKTKREDIRQSPRSIIHYMELTRLQDGIPVGSVASKSFANPVAKYNHAICVEEAKGNSD